MKLSGFLLVLLFASLVGTLVLRLALWPAFRMAGVRKKKHLPLITGCFLMSMFWILGTGGAQVAQLQIGFSNRRITQASDWLWLVCGGLSFLAAGAACGAVARRTAPLPGAFTTATVAGGAVGVLFTVPAVLTKDAAQAPPLPVLMLLGTLQQLAWFGLPIAAIYWAAFTQHRRVARFGMGSCIRCNYKKVGRQEVCTGCGKTMRHLCHHCRHIVDARPGAPCPRCKATIAARCWTCGYDWRGLDSPRCPECGVWKPTPPDPPANPASPPASLY